MVDGTAVRLAQDCSLWMRFADVLRSKEFEYVTNESRMEAAS